MKSLNTTGLSLSQANSISNLINQRALDIKSNIDTANNFSKSIKVDNQEHNLINPKPIPSNIFELIEELGNIHATQAFLMENIKAKDALIKAERSKKFTTELVAPKSPTYEVATTLPEVDEAWGWNKLSESEYNEYLEMTAIASHIGQFIHKNSTLDRLRKELPTIPAIEFFELKKDEKIPVAINVHHTQEQLLSIHNEMASKHRDAEMRVNYFKAKVKNLVTTENARIANENANVQNKINSSNKLLQDAYLAEVREYQSLLLKEQQEFEAKRNEEIKRLAALRISVDPRFQKTIDLFLTKEAN
jgi:hypothetical protein